MFEGSVHTMSDRCKRICGTHEGGCYVDNKSQLNCIADLVINKSSNISMGLGVALSREMDDTAREMVLDSIANANELSNWIKYLQVAGNMSALSSLVLDTDSQEKRSEMRYPLPESQRGNIEIELSQPHGKCAGPIVDFSQSGLRVACKSELAPSTQLVCTLRGKSNSVVFSGTVQYCNPVGAPEYLIGIRITQVRGKEGFNFFNEVYQILTGL